MSTMTRLDPKRAARREQLIARERVVRLRRFQRQRRYVVQARRAC